jgi:hypothetical protein
VQAIGSGSVVLMHLQTGKLRPKLAIAAKERKIPRVAFATNLCKKNQYSRILFGL